MDMNAWLTTQIGAEAANIVSYIALFVAAIIVLWLIIMIIKRFTRGTYVVGGKNREARLSVRDAAPIDSKRRLVLIKRDNVEHLILIGGPIDLVIETNISKLSLPSDNSSEILGFDNLGDEPNQVMSDIFPASTSSANMSVTAGAPGQSSGQTQEKQNLSGFDNISSNIESNIEKLQSHTPNDGISGVNSYTSPKLEVAKASQSDSNTAIDVATNQDSKVDALSSSRNDSASIEEIASPRLNEENDNWEAEETVFDEETPSIHSHDSQGDEVNFEAADKTAYDEKIQSDELQERKFEADAEQSFAPQEKNADSAPIKNKLSNTVVATNEVNTSIASLKSASTNNAIKDGNNSEQTSFKKVSDSNQSDPVASGYTSLRSGLKRPTGQEVKEQQSKQFLRGETSHQKNQDNPFGTPKPINPYKIMKAAGVFRGSNVNFNATISNAPINKGTTASDKSKLSSNNDDSRNIQPRFATPASLNNVESTVFINKNEQVSEEKIQEHKGETGAHVSAVDTPSVKPSGQDEKNFDKNTSKNATQPKNASGNAASNIGSTNPVNRGQAENSPMQGFLPTDKARSSQERPIAQRSVPQGMLRPPLMAKPRNAAVTSVDSQLKKVSGLDAALDNATKLSQSSTMAKATESKKPTSVNTDTNTESRKPLPRSPNDIATDNGQISNDKPQASKDNVKNKNVNLQKFSLQLLEPQHILDKPSRNEQIIDTITSKTASQMTDEDEFDRRLKNELNQPEQK
ncbi:flagellar biosynthetic protein FliO [Bartonella sp. HY038]|uniref:flagellar biosynthetic protein FliO n=1 Tax=Bartonella sp. HY038 TaxID=2759660 RepID=UPI0015FD4EEF|nr:flagellar biosynthetic protein FliO [Bartonella sp. HY038]